MKKKSSANPPVHISSSSKILLDEIQKKLSNSSALNGGFDTLLYKIDKIEQGQGQLVTKVDKIHDAIYDPNDGIFSKMSEFKLEHANKVNELSQSLVEINEWKRHKEKEVEKDNQVVNDAIEKVAYLEKHVDTLVKSKESTWAFLKWILVAIGGGIVTLLFAWLESRIK